jgi:hypothetical protein
LLWRTGFGGVALCCAVLYLPNRNFDMKSSEQTWENILSIDVLKTWNFNSRTLIWKFFINVVVWQKNIFL